jgi:vancomycin permeability regulator SanA
VLISMRSSLLLSLVRVLRPLLGRAILAALAAVCVAHGEVERRGVPIITDASAVPVMPVAIVFGAGYTRTGPNLVLYDRVATAVDLYRSGKVRKLLMTGDNSTVSHNEPQIMRRTAREMGVPDRDIVLDYAGFRTYDSLYRAREIFGVDRVVLVTQRDHLPRALYLARALGIEAVGISADRRSYGAAQRWFSLREALSVEDAWIDVNLLHPQPTFLGKKEPIFPK